MRIRLCIGVMFLCCLATGANAQSQPGTLAPKQQVPSTDDQLALVRVRARILDAQSRMQQAQRNFDQAQKDLKDAEPEFAPLLNAVKAKLPKPSSGKIWQPRDDGQMGITFFEVDAPAVPEAAVAEKPKPAGREKSPPKEE